jgi:hypothetical protein
MNKGLFVKVFILCVAGCTSFDHLTMVTEEFPKAKQCGKCHVEIFREWTVSDHATAYINPHFRQMTDNYAFGDCMSCHVPQPTVSETPPVVRSMHRDEGITCVSCHLEEGKLSGPMEPTGKVAPHPIGIKPEFYKSSAICGNCHEGSYEEWQSVEDSNKKSCQDCHMSPVERKVTQATGGFSDVIVGFEEKVAQRRHDFTILNAGLTEQPVSIETERSGSDLVLVVKNNLPHNLPTGDFGYRVLLMEIFTISQRGSIASLGKREFAKELGNAFQPMGSARWMLAIPPQTKAIRISLRRQSYEGDPVLNLMDIEVPLQ